MRDFFSDIKDLKTVSQNTSLAEMGMDSMMAVEIKQCLERDFEVFLTPQDIRVLNIAKLMEMSAKDLKKQTKQVKKAVAKAEHVTGIRLLMKTMNVSILSEQYCIELPVKCGEKKNEVFLIPGIEGSAAIFTDLTPKLKIPVTCLQLGIYDTDESVEEMAERLLPVRACLNKICFSNYGKKERNRDFVVKKCNSFYFSSSMF